MQPLPSPELYLPGGHDRQEPEEVRPVEVVYFPLGQLEQEVLPVELWYVFSGQLLQPLPDPRPYFPAGHDRQELEEVAP